MAVRSDQLRHYLGRLALQPASDTLSDAQLLERFVRQRDQEAFAALAARHGPMVLSLCRRLTRDQHAAEDIVQAAFLVLARKAASVRPGHRLASWLHGVARNLALRFLRGHNRRVNRETQSVRRAPHPPQPDPLDELSARELLAILDEELERLPEVHRLPLILCYLEGRSQDQIARQLGWTPGSVKGRLERGRARLHQRLARRGLLGLVGLELLHSSAVAALPALRTGTLAKAASTFAAGGTAGSTISAAAVSLAEAGLRSFALAKLKLGLVLFLALGTISAGAGIMMTPEEAQHPVSRAVAVAQATDHKPERQRRHFTQGSRKTNDASEAKNLKGDWQAVEGEWSGEKRITDWRIRRLVLSGDDFIELVNGDHMGRAKKYKLNPAASPKEIDIISPDAKENQLGIYSFANGRLRICTKSAKAGKRPTHFNTKFADGCALLVYERVAADPKPTLDFAKIRGDWKDAEKQFEDSERAAHGQNGKREKPPEPPDPQLFAARFVRFAEEQPKASLALSALCWAALNAPAKSRPAKRAVAILKDGALARADFGELKRALEAAYGPTIPSTILAPLVLERVKQNLENPQAARLLDWICGSYVFDASGQAPRAFDEAADLIVARFADSPDICHLSEACFLHSPPWAGRYEKHLRTIFAKNKDRMVRYEALFALASIAGHAGQSRQEEAAKLYEQFIKDFSGLPKDHSQNMLDSCSERRARNSRESARSAWADRRPR